MAFGSLARDGVSCAACHQMSKEGLGKPETFTGQFKLDPFNVVNGPYEEVATLPMKNALGITPRYGEHIKSSAMCGSCHTVILPVFDNKGKQFKDKSGQPKAFHEQTTYPEWQNSVYQNERSRIIMRPGRPASVHMQTTSRAAPHLQRRQLETTLPYRSPPPDKDITVRVRDKFSSIPHRSPFADDVSLFHMLAYAQPIHVCDGFLAAYAQSSSYTLA